MSDYVPIEVLAKHYAAGVPRMRLGLRAMNLMDEENRPTLVAVVCGYYKDGLWDAERVYKRDKAYSSRVKS